MTTIKSKGSPCGRASSTSRMMALSSPTVISTLGCLTIKFTRPILVILPSLVVKWAVVKESSHHVTLASDFPHLKHVGRHSPPLPPVDPVALAKHLASSRSPLDCIAKLSEIVEPHCATPWCYLTCPTADNRTDCGWKPLAIFGRAVSLLLDPPPAPLAARCTGGHSVRVARAIADAPSTDFPWSAISTEALLAELTRRDDAPAKPKCGSGTKGSYDTAIHVFALFLILVVSTVGMQPMQLCGFSFLWWQRSRMANVCHKQHADFPSSPGGSRRARSRARSSSSPSTSARVFSSLPHSSISSRRPSSR